MNNSSATAYSQFKPRDYLNYYYTRIDEENQSLLEFFADSYKDVPKDSLIMEFGGGPTIYQIISATVVARQIDFGDYLQSNLDEIIAWKDKTTTAFDWEPFIKRALEIEGLPKKETDVKARQEMVRDKLKEIILVDAFKKDPAGAERRGKYDVLSVIFVPEGITDSKAGWQSAFGNILSLLKPGGTLVTAAITEAKYWKSGPQVLPAAYLKKEDFEETFIKLGLTIKNIKTIPSEILDDKDPGYTGYRGMVFIKAVKA